MPVRLLRGYKPEDITKIYIYLYPVEGWITDETTVRTIAEKLYEYGAEKAGISFLRMGGVFPVFLYAGDNVV